MTGLLNDFKFAFRMLWKNPGLSSIAVLALALGIGFTTIMFSIVNGALLKGLPFRDSQEIMHLERSNLAAGIESMEVTIHDFMDWREQQRSFEDIAGFYNGTVNISGTERAERFDGAFMSANGLTQLGVQPFLGRLFREGEDTPGAEGVFIVGYDVWRDRYNSDPGVVGRVERVNGEQMTLVGVMPEGFSFPLAQEAWLPLRMDHLALERGADGQLTLEVFGRLNDGVSADQAALDMNQIAQRLATAYPASNEGVGALVKPYTEEYIGSDVSAMLFTMLGFVVLVLVIACANVANLLLARAAVRSKEVAVRTAMGAGRWRVVMQLMAEAMVLSTVGAIIGVGLAWYGITAFNAAIAPTDPPFWIDIDLAPKVLAFVTAITVLSAVISGMIPALRASGADVSGVLKDEARGSSSLKVGRLAKTLVVVEVAASVAVLVAAGLMAKTVINLRSMDFEFATEDVFTARIGLFESTFPTVATRQEFFRDVIDRVRAEPGVSAAALATGLPGLGVGGSRFALQGQSYERDQDYPFTRQVAVTPGFFETFAVDLLQGRDFTLQDDADGVQVAIVTQEFVDRHLSGEDPLGGQIRLGTSESTQPWLSIVGVVPDMFLGGMGNPDDPNPPGIFTPYAQGDGRFMSLAVRTQGNPMALTPRVREIVAAVDRDTPIYWVDSLAARIAETTWFYRVFGTLFIIFGASALFMAAVGLYGVMSFSVSRRTQELGVRMALGAQGSHVLRMVMKQGFGQLALGMLLGFVLAAGITRGLVLMLYQVEPRDPVIFGTIAVVLMVTGMLATFVPARRATRVDPMEALRYE